jgi:hypothetical protein
LDTKLTDKKVIIVIIAVAAVVVIAVAAVVLIGMSRVVFLKSGDYVRYDVTGVDQYGNPISGQMILTVLNATATSYDAKYEYPGLGIPTTTQHINQVPALTILADLGTKTQSNVKLETAFGNKTVDAYLKNTEGQVWTSYAGSNPLVQYKIVVTIGSASMTFVLSETNIEKVRTGNAT